MHVCVSECKAVRLHVCELAIGKMLFLSNLL